MKNKPRMDTHTHARAHARTHALIHTHTHTRARARARAHHCRKPSTSYLTHTFNIEHRFWWPNGRHNLPPVSKWLAWEKRCPDKQYINHQRLQHGQLVTLCLLLTNWTRPLAPAKLLTILKQRNVTNGGIQSPTWRTEFQQLQIFNNNNNNKSIFKAQNLFPRDYSKRAHTHYIYIHR